MRGWVVFMCECMCGGLRVGVCGCVNNMCTFRCCIPCEPLFKVAFIHLFIRIRSMKFLKVLLLMHTCVFFIVHSMSASVFVDSKTFRHLYARVCTTSKRQYWARAKERSPFIHAAHIQVMRNRTAELCLEAANEHKLHYMSIKRRLIAELGPAVFETHKRVVQSVFRSYVGE